MIRGHDFRHPGMGNGTGCAVMVADGVLCDQAEASHHGVLAEWDKLARRAVDWGIVYENPEAIVALVAKVRAVEALAAHWLAHDMDEETSTLLTFREASEAVTSALLLAAS